MLVDGHAYPRPQLQRDSWQSLNGVWEFAIDSQLEWTVPAQVEWDLTILVPFSPETSSSGVQNTGLYSSVWYRRSFERPTLQPGERLVLHFGAVDYSATVWVNQIQISTHQGGYTPFQVDVTEVLAGDGLQEIVVHAQDDPADLAKPRGKQDWQLDSHSIWYPRTTGIWQTVWMEILPATYIEALKWTASLERWDIGIEARVGGDMHGEWTLTVRLHSGDQVLAADTYRIISGEVNRRIALSDPGIDDYRNQLLWSPQSPTIINAELELRDSDGHVVDRVFSYTAIRAVAIQGDRFILNGRPLILRMVLDQGYWPETGLTAPNDEALLQDVLLAKKLGFNGVRKHQKIENPRFLYWADHMGLLVWEEMPSAYRYTRRSIDRLTREWIEVIRRDLSHPCIVTWVPFNESWGVPDLPESPAQRNFVQALYHLTKALDPSRPVIGNDGWESVATDIIGIHDYDAKPESITRRYAANSVDSTLFPRERPGGRMLIVDGKFTAGQPIVLTEFGGIALGNNLEDDNWGYSHAGTPAQFLQSYSHLLEAVRSLPSLAGFCYTQFTDTYQETNGLLYADRTPKVSIDEIALATSGRRPDFDKQEEAIWRERIMERQHPFNISTQRSGGD